jgi:beta-N-acetylhexosaminidase
VVFSYPGRQPPRALVRRIERGEAAGVMLYARNIRSRAHLRRTLAGLQRAARRSPVHLPLLLLLDQEGGFVQRLPGGPTRSAARVGSARGAYRTGLQAGSTLRRVNVNVNLAPVADVCRRKSVLERELRCYGRNVSVVRARTRAFARGLRRRGVVPAAKHFPGLGAARTNTDDGPVTIRVSRSTLRRVDERPFAGLAPMLMLSNAVYPALDRNRVAALSRAVIVGELRRRMHYRGVTLSDAFDTPTGFGLGGPQRIALTAARAGLDLILFAHTYADSATAARTLESAIRSGRIPRAAAVQSADRVLSLRRRAARNKG